MVFWLQRLEALSGIDDEHVKEQARGGRISVAMWNKYLSLSVDQRILLKSARNECPGIILRVCTIF